MSTEREQQLTDRKWDTALPEVITILQNEAVTAEKEVKKRDLGAMTDNSHTFVFVTNSTGPEASQINLESKSERPNIPGSLTLSFVSEKICVCQNGSELGQCVMRMKVVTVKM